MKPHLVVHCIVLVCLGSLGTAAWVSGTVNMGRQSIIPFAIALFGAIFGIWKTVRFSRNINSGCEITVTTAEAKVFPYFFYFVSIVLVAFLFIVPRLFVSCARSRDDYMAIHMDGMLKLEASRQMNAHYHEVDNFIVHFGSGEQPLEWQTVAFIEGRFNLTYVQPVKVNYFKRTVMPAGDPKFYLHAAESVRVSPGGIAGTSYDCNLQRVFGKAEWDKFVASGYDMTSLGIPRDEIHQIPNWSEHVRSWRKDRVPIK